MVSGKLELIFDHEVIPGAFNPGVLARLETEAFYISADDFDGNIHVIAPERTDMRLQDEFDAIAAYENNEILVWYNTEPLENALYDACIDVGMSDDDASKEYCRYRAFSNKKSAYMESARRLGIDFYDIRSRFVVTLNNVLGTKEPQEESLDNSGDKKEPVETFETLSGNLKRLLRTLDLTLAYNEPTRVMFVSAHRIIDNVRHLSRIGTLRSFLDLTQKQFEPILDAILKGNTYDTTDEKPKRHIERSTGPRDPG